MRRYSALVFSVGRRAGLDSAEAEDVAQATFASLLTALPVMRDRQSLAKWLITVAQRHAWKAVRARKSQGTSSIQATIDPPTEPDDAPDVGTWERRQAVRRALIDLGGRCQELLTALFGERGGGDYQEISRQVGIPVGSIGPTRNRCLRKLLDILGRQGGSTAIWSEREQEILRGQEGADVSESVRGDT